MYEGSKHATVLAVVVRGGWTDARHWPLQDQAKQCLDDC